MFWTGSKMLGAMSLPKFSMIFLLLCRALKRAEAIRASGGSAREYDKYMKMFVECVFMQTLTTVIKWEMIPQRPTDLQLPEKSFETKRLMYLDQLKDSNENSSLSFNNVFRILEIPPGFTN